MEKKAAIGINGQSFAGQCFRCWTSCGSEIAKFTSKFPQGISVDAQNGASNPSLLYTMVGDLSQSRLYDQSAYWDENPGYSLFPVNLTNGVFTVRNKEATIDGCEPKEREVIPDFWDPSQPPRIVPEVDCIGPPNCGYWTNPNDFQFGNAPPDLSTKQWVKGDCTTTQDTVYGILEEVRLFPVCGKLEVQDSGSNYYQFTRSPYGTPEQHEILFLLVKSVSPDASISTRSEHPHMVGTSNLDNVSYYYRRFGAAALTGGINRGRRFDNNEEFRNVGMQRTLRAVELGKITIKACCEEGACKNSATDPIYNPKFRWWDDGQRGTTCNNNTKYFPEAHATSGMQGDPDYNAMGFGGPFGQPKLSPGGRDGEFNREARGTMREWQRWDFQGYDTYAEAYNALLELSYISGINRFPQTDQSFATSTQNEFAVFQYGKGPPVEEPHGYHGGIWHGPPKPPKPANWAKYSGAGGKSQLDRDVIVKRHIGGRATTIESLSGVGHDVNLYNFKLSVDNDSFDLDSSTEYYPLAETMGAGLSGGTAPMESAAIIGVEFYEANLSYDGDGAAINEEWNLDFGSPIYQKQFPFECQITERLPLGFQQLKNVTKTIPIPLLTTVLTYK